VGLVISNAPKVKPKVFGGWIKRNKLEKIRKTRILYYVKTMDCNPFFPQFSPCENFASSSVFLFWLKKWSSLSNLLGLI